MAIEITSDHLLTEERLKHHMKIYAGPGAGKTHLLAENVKNIVRTNPKIKNSKRRKILCITYTNAAVAELKRRLDDYSSNVEVYTIHGFIIKYIIKPYQTELKKHMLNDFGIEIKTQGKITSQNEGLGILHGHEKEKIFEYIKKEISEIANQLEYSKKIMGEVEIDIQKFCDDGTKVIKKSDKINDSHKVAIKKYVWSEVKKLTHNEILYFGYRIVKENSTVAYALRVQFPYIFVDEFQDTNPLQAILIDYLGQKSSIVGVIGDIAQSIYSFQGAKPSKFSEFNIRGETDTYEYQIFGNRRSTKNIINLCNYIRRSDNLRQKGIKEYNDEAQKEKIEKIKVSFIVGKTAESFQKINNIVKTGGVVLTRTWAASFNYMEGISDPQKKVLKKIYNSYYASQIDIRSEIAEHNNVKWVRAFKFIFLLFDAYVSKAVSDIIKAFQLYISIDDLIKDASFKVQTVVLLNKLLKEVFKNLSEIKPAVEVINSFNATLQKNEYEKIYAILVGHNKIPSENFTISCFSEEDKDDFKNDVSSLEWKTAYQLFRTVFSKESKYMTVHQAKGLEWEKVIVSLEPSKFDRTTFLKMFNDPKILKETPEDEFTRMFFVACSRAKEELYIHIKDDTTTLFNGLKSFIGEENFNNFFLFTRLIKKKSISDTS